MYFLTVSVKMLSTKNTFILLLMLSVCMVTCLCLTDDVVYIQSSDGEPCSMSDSPCYNISMFGKMASSFSNSSGLEVYFLEGTHLLDLAELVVLTNLSNAVFEGEGMMEQSFHETVQQSTVVINCTQQSGGIAFVDGFNITFKYLTITNCGVSMHEYIVHANLQGEIFSSDGSAALGFFNTSDVTVDHASIQNWNSGIGLLVVLSGFDLIINNSSFTRYGEPYFEGSSVVVIYTDPLDCVYRDEFYDSLIANSNITSFGGDEYPYMCHQVNESTSGIFVAFMQRTYRVQLMLDSVVVYGIRGLGNIVIISNEIDKPNYNLTISNTHSSHTNGHSLHTFTRPQFAFVTSSANCPTNLSYSDHDSIIFIADSYFTNNTNYNTSAGSAVWIAFLSAHYSPAVKIQSIEISNNVGYCNGLQIFFITYQEQLYVTLSNVSVKKISCDCQEKCNKQKEQQSAILISFVSSLNLRNVSISDNTMTGLTVYGTNVAVHGESVFSNNTGIDGGGLAMYGESHILLKKDSILTFVDNKALRGGAIFVDDDASAQFEYPCFFQFPGLTQVKSAKLTFSNNEASIAGSVLYGSNDCSLYSEQVDTYCTQSCFNKTFDYSTQTGLSVLASKPYWICFCEENIPNCSDGQYHSVSAYPGEQITISLVTVGRNNGVAPGIINLFEDSGELQQYTYNTTVLWYNTAPMSCTNISFKANHSKYILRVPDKPPQFYTVLNISMFDCPLGFDLQNDSCRCDELKEKAVSPEIVKCNAANKKFTRQGDIWIGIITNISNVSECVVLHNTCPFDYCNAKWVTFTISDPDPQCALNRTGTLCGGCKEGFSLALGSNNCIECHNFFTIFLIIPFAVAGVGLVALLLLLNLTVSVGTINGLIFYASIVKISESSGIFFPNGTIPVLSQFIAWLNLDLGIETCFYDGMKAYAKVWLQFVFPLYIWFIIATIIILCRYSKWLSNKVGGNIVQVLATLILLSFTKLFRNFAPALAWIPISCVNNNSETQPVWYIDANVSLNSSDRWPLIPVAVLFLIIAVLYTLALLFDPLIERYMYSTKIKLFRKWWIKFKPFVDAYNGPYKDSCRFWTGLLLLIRMVFTLSALYLDTFSTLVFITTSNTLILAFMVVFEGAYQKRHLNILESSSYLNLGLLSALTAVYQNDDSNGKWVTIVSVGVALVTFTGVLIYHLFLRLRNIKYFQRLLKNVFGRRNQSERLVEDEHLYEKLVEPTSSEVYLRRETLISSTLN